MVVLFYKLIINYLKKIHYLFIIQNKPCCGQYMPLVITHPSSHNKLSMFLSSVSTALPTGEGKSTRRVCRRPWVGV